MTAASHESKRQVEDLPRHVIAALERTAEAHRTSAAMRYKEDGEWRSITWGAYRDMVRHAALGFIDLGLDPGKGVAIIGFNRPEWFVSELAAVAAGGVPAGIYTTLTPDQIHYVATHCEAGIVVVENQELLQKVLEVRERLPDLRSIVVMEDADAGHGSVSWRELTSRGRAADDTELKRRVAALDADGLCSLIYTSGTTGLPKAVMLSHRNILWTAKTVTDLLGFESSFQLLSYLPLSHIAEKMVSLYGPLTVGATAWFAESLDKLPENLAEVRPHAFLGVPRVWEKIQAAMEAAGAQSSPLRKRLVRWARGVGLAGGYAEQAGDALPRFYGLARRLVFSKVRAKLGLDRAVLCVSSAAPISEHTLEFFLSLGIPILEIYGMSECTGPGTVSLPGRYQIGKAGFAFPGAELKIARDGEICMRGPHVFLGYYKDPEATSEAVDSEGWLHSGDVGEVDENGFLSVTDRLKELIITSGGKNVAPQLIEAKLKAIPAIALPAVIGDRRKYLSALITLDPERVAREAESAGSTARDAAAAADCSVFRRYLQRQIERVNETLASFETIKRFAILPGQFTIEGGELTPTMKLKRRVIVEKYASEIEALYPT
jgi:long-subunit acyl-CoA synthetase (AMP-forming)